MRVLPKFSKKDVPDDQLSFEKLFKCYYPRLCFYCKRIVGDQDQAEDIVQEVFLKYWDKKEEVAGHEMAIKKFLYTSVHHASLNFVRHNKVVKNYLEKLDDNPLDSQNVVYAMIRSEVSAILYHALEKLPPSCQRISRMAFIHEMKNHEIAEKLNLSVTTVKTQKRRGMELLRLMLKPDMFLLLMVLIDHADDL